MRDATREKPVISALFASLVGLDVACTTRGTRDSRSSVPNSNRACHRGTLSQSSTGWKERSSRFRCKVESKRTPPSGDPPAVRGTWHGFRFRNCPRIQRVLIAQTSPRTASYSILQQVLQDPKTSKVLLGLRQCIRNERVADARSPHRAEQIHNVGASGVQS